MKRRGCNKGWECVEVCIKVYEYVEREIISFVSERTLPLALLALEPPLLSIWHHHVSATNQICLIALPDRNHKWLPGGLAAAATPPLHALLLCHLNLRFNAPLKHFHRITWLELCPICSLDCRCLRTLLLAQSTDLTPAEFLFFPERNTYENRHF